jgi:hypothetical protein
LDTGIVNERALKMASWKDSRQIEIELETRRDQMSFEKIGSLYSLHYFLYGALPQKNCNIHSPFEDAIFVSEYGRHLLSKVDVSAFTDRILL